MMMLSLFRTINTLVRPLYSPSFTPPHYRTLPYSITTSYYYLLSAYYAYSLSHTKRTYWSSHLLPVFFFLFHHIFSFIFSYLLSFYFNFSRQYFSLNGILFSFLLLLFVSPLSNITDHREDPLPYYKSDTYLTLPLILI